MLNCYFARDGFLIEEMPVVNYNNATGIQILLILILLKISTHSAFAQFDIQGHRGCRGLMPENTIPGFLKAVESGVRTIEMDVVITSDNQVLVSHEPYMSHEICKGPDDKPITARSEKSHNIYLMTAAQVQEYDCGTNFLRKFPQQQKFKAQKPLLKEVIDATETFIKENGFPPVWYNIEIKSDPRGDLRFHPLPSAFADLVMQVVDAGNITSRTIIQSFDIRVLRHVKRENFQVQLALLVENLRGVKYNLKKLGFKPDIYSPYYKLLTKRNINFLHEQNIRVIPWTVNSSGDMKKLIDKGVDGIITDYPDRLITILKTEKD
jgi:glycerophosphoryl diester phosphodiesterase